MKRRQPMPRGKPLEQKTPLVRKTPMPRSGHIRSRGSVGDASPDGPTTKPECKGTGPDVKSGSRNASRRNGPTKPRLESSTIPQAIRAAVLERDAYSCQRCGRYLVDTIRYGLQHRRPRGAGGSRLLHTMANLVTLCGWVGDAGTCTDQVEEQDREQATAEGWLLPKRIRTVTPEEWPVLRWTAAGHEWQQPGDTWRPATPHPRQLEMGAAA